MAELKISNNNRFHFHFNNYHNYFIKTSNYTSPKGISLDKIRVLKLFIVFYNKQKIFSKQVTL